MRAPTLVLPVRHIEWTHDRRCESDTRKLVTARMADWASRNCVLSSLPLRGKLRTASYDSGLRAPTLVLPVRRVAPDALEPRLERGRSRAPSADRAWRSRRAAASCAPLRLPLTLQRRQRGPAKGATNPRATPVRMGPVEVSPMLWMPYPRRRRHSSTNAGTHIAQAPWISPSDARVALLAKKQECASRRAAALSIGERVTSAGR